MHRRADFLASKFCNLFSLLSLLNRDGIFLSNGDSVSQEFNLRPTQFLEWYGVLNSTPDQWK